MTDKEDKKVTKVAKNSKWGAAPGERRGGRGKGTPNKRTADFMERLGAFDIVGEMLELYKQTNDEILKAQILKTLMEYAYPKRKAVEMAADMNINTESIQIELI